MTHVNNSLLYAASLVVIAVTALLVPSVSQAQGTSPTDLKSLSNAIIDIINEVLVPLLLAIAFIVFVWGVFRYFIASTDEAKEKGRDVMVYGLIGFFVIISVWGIVNILTDTVKLDEKPEFNLPEAKRS